jgi:acyl-CoA reductase-like NAD-dependent aldehyde dehydrogenase
MDSAATECQSYVKTFDVLNPATGETLAQLPRMGIGDAEKGISAAGDSWARWKNTTGHERAKFLTRMYDLVDNYRDDLATIITLESGKPLSEAKGEVAYASKKVTTKTHLACHGPGLQHLHTSHIHIHHTPHTYRLLLPPLRRGGKAHHRRYADLR